MTGRALRLLILDTGDPRTPSGGQSAFVRNVVSGLPWRISLGVPTTGPSSERHALVAGREVELTKLADSGDPARRPVVPLRLRCLLGGLLKLRRPLSECDVVYVQSIELLIPALLLGQKPVVFHIHGAANPLSVSRYKWARGRFPVAMYRWLYHTLLSRVNLVLSVDRAGADLCALGAGMSAPCAIVPVCYDADLFNPDGKAGARHRLGLKQEPWTAIFVGRLEAAKGTNLLLEAIAAADLTGCSSSLVVVGDGSQREPMRLQSAALGIDVSFAGWVPHAQLSDYLNAADVMILPSIAEGVPTAAVEAMACGTPVIASAVGGLPELVVERVSGVLVHGFRVEDWASAIGEARRTHWCAERVRSCVADYALPAVCGRLDTVLRGIAETSNGREIRSAGSQELPR